MCSGFSLDLHLVRLLVLRAGLRTEQPTSPCLRLRQCLSASLAPNRYCHVRRQEQKGAEEVAAVKWSTPHTCRSGQTCCTLTPKTVDDLHTMTGILAEAAESSAMAKAAPAEARGRIR